ncbi:aldehyde dehydrogenase family protein [Bdellovibrionota bacterium FG-2]
MAKLTVKNPYTDAKLAELAYASENEISQKLSLARSAFQRWRHASAFRRAELLTQIAADLEDRHEEFARLICHEAGKPLSLAHAEVNRAIGVFRWASAEASRFSGEMLRLDVGAAQRRGFGIHTRFPRGVVLGISPFNFPLNLVAHKVAPAIACGCSILIKPSPYTPLTAMKLAELFSARELDSEPGLVQVVLADDQATAKLTEVKEIAMVSFTGSETVGWMIRRQTPEKPVALELGGNAWVVVSEDTPATLFPLIAQKIANAAFGYAGQSCISVQNVAVAGAIFSQFSKCLREATQKTAFGDPEKTEVICGPMIHEQAMARIEKLLSEVKSQGIECMESDHKIQEQGSSSGARLIAPTLVSFAEGQDAGLGSALMSEELFAPVAVLTQFSRLEDLIQRINAGRFGLQAGIFTQRIDIAEKVYAELEVGGVIVNDVPTTRYDHQPYGGVKQSGSGREGIRYAMEEMTESKFMALSGGV